MESLGFATASEPLIATALWTAGGAFAASLAMLAGIALSRILLLRRLGRERRSAELWNPLLAHCTEGVPATLPRLRRGDAESFLLLWCRAQETLRGEAQDHLREMARRLGAEAHARALAGSRKMRRRLLGIVALGHLRARDLAPRLYPLIQAAPPMVSLTAAKALVRIDAALALPPLLAAATRRADWPLGSVASVLRECDARGVGPALSGAIRAALQQADGEGIARLLRLHVAADAEALRDAVLEVLAACPDPEALAAALGALWRPEDLGHARHLLGHTQWFVRVAAVRALARLGGEADAAHLERALADPSWWVRCRAAQGLCGLPGMEASQLGALATRLTDRYAGDMLRQALAERTPA